jgi:hypothetical protein
VRIAVRWNEASTWRGVVALTVFVLGYPQAHGVEEIILLGMGVLGILGIATTDSQHPHEREGHH